MTHTIQVRYSCPDCGLRDQPCAVMERGGEDVVTWTRAILIVMVAQDHKQRSPECRARSLCNVKVPMNGNRVGECPGTLN